MANDENKYKTQLKRFKIKTLSPLHIADSQPWQKDFDFIYHEKSHTVFFIDDNDFLKQMDVEFLKKTDDIETYRDKMLEMFKQRKLKTLRQYSIKHTIEQIYPFIRDSLSPIIPGSSLKGAFRTAVLSQIIAKIIAGGDTVSTSPEKYLEKQVGWKRDNIKMSMDAIQISDFPFQVEKLGLSRFGTYSLSKNIFLEKKDKTRVVEAIPPETLLNDTLDIRWVYREKDKTEFVGIPEIIDITTTIREHYKSWIPQEIEFLKKYPSSEIEPVVLFYESLMKKIGGGAILLNLGFGTGWEGKTGAFLKNNRSMWGRDISDYLNAIDSDYKKQKHLFSKVSNDSRYKQYPFPKSRKFADYKGKLFPPGWIELTLKESQ